MGVRAESNIPVDCFLRILYNRLNDSGIPHLWISAEISGQKSVNRTGKNPADRKEAGKNHDEEND